MKCIIKNVVDLKAVARGSRERFMNKSGRYLSSKSTFQRPRQCLWYYNKIQIIFHNLSFKRWVFTFYLEERNVYKLTKSHFHRWIWDTANSWYKMLWTAQLGRKPSFIFIKLRVKMAYLFKIISKTLSILCVCLLVLLVGFVIKISVKSCYWPT